MIGTLAFALEIQYLAREKKNKKHGVLLAMYEHEVKQMKKEVLLFPIHTGGNHWISGFVDFKRKTYGYGEHTRHVCHELKLIRHFCR